MLPIHGKCGRVTQRRRETDRGLVDENSLEPINPQEKRSLTSPLPEDDSSQEREPKKMKREQNAEEEAVARENLRRKLDESFPDEEEGSSQERKIKKMKKEKGAEDAEDEEEIDPTKTEETGLEQSPPKVEEDDEVSEEPQGIAEEYEEYLQNILLWEHQVAELDREQREDNLNQIARAHENPESVEDQDEVGTQARCSRSEPPRHNEENEVEKMMEERKTHQIWAVMTYPQFFMGVAGSSGSNGRREGEGNESDSGQSTTVSRSRSEESIGSYSLSEEDLDVAIQDILDSLHQLSHQGLDNGDNEEF